MQTLKMFKETALPAVLTPHAIYLIAPAAQPQYVEMYVTDAAGQAKRIINQPDVQALITTALAEARELRIVADIAARNALNPQTALHVYVKNATGDPTVKSGGATYLYDVAAAQWVKVSEAESLDVVLSWSSIEGRPGSTPAQIDAAVQATHTHANKTQLDKVGEDGAGNLTYGGQYPRPAWDSTGW